MNKNFIRTSDENVANELRKNGFPDLGKQGDMYCFLNKGTMTFSEEDQKKISYTNMLTV